MLAFLVIVYITATRQENVGVNNLKSTEEKAITKAFEKHYIIYQWFILVLPKTVILFLANQILYI